MCRKGNDASPVPDRSAAPPEGISRCRWVNLKNPRYVEYHDREWGVPCHDDRQLYELLILETFQAGLSWECVLNKRAAFRAAYDNFELEKVIRYGEDRLQALQRNGAIIRNRLKIRASITNSRIFQRIQRQYGSFREYVERFTGKQVIYEPYSLRTTSPLSDALSEDLKQRGMSFAGSTVIYSYLQSAGFINAHGEECCFYRSM